MHLHEVRLDTAHVHRGHAPPRRRTVRGGGPGGGRGGGNGGGGGLRGGQRSWRRRVLRGAVGDQIAEQQEQSGAEQTDVPARVVTDSRGVGGVGARAQLRPEQRGG